MKNFIWFKKSVWKTEKRLIKIYSIKKNTLNYIGELVYTINSTRWDRSEVYNFLIDKNYIPKKAYDYSVNNWSWPWYYRELNPFCNINIIS